MDCYLGIDVGSVTAKLVAIREEDEVIFAWHERTHGRPVEAVQRGVRAFARAAAGRAEVRGAGATGSGRRLAATLIGADEVKTEITAHATAALRVHPEARTIIDIGGQDAKLIHLRDGVLTGFNMNTVCAAGTGSFLDHQAARLGIPVQEFGACALRSRAPVRIAGRCGVFAESDLIHKQQMGHAVDDLVAGLCISLARNFLQNVARDATGRRMAPAILFQGGVAANAGMRAAFERLLGQPLVVPEHYTTMGAWGVAMLARRWHMRSGRQTVFRGMAALTETTFSPRSFSCGDCANNCEISELRANGDAVSRWGGRCGKWDNLALASADRGEEREAPLAV